MNIGITRHENESYTQNGAAYAKRTEDSTFSRSANGIGDARRDTNICIVQFKTFDKTDRRFWAVISITEMVSPSAPISVITRESDKSPKIIRKNVYVFCVADENGDFRIRFSFVLETVVGLSRSCGQRNMRAVRSINFL